VAHENVGAGATNVPREYITAERPGRESERPKVGQAGTEVPVLCVVRPDLSDGCDCVCEFCRGGSQWIRGQSIFACGIQFQADRCGPRFATVFHGFLGRPRPGSSTGLFPRRLQSKIAIHSDAGAFVTTCQRHHDAGHSQRIVSTGSNRMARSAGSTHEATATAKISAPETE
jgi:hypothetical protein